MRVEFAEIGKPDGLTGREPPARGFDCMKEAAEHVGHQRMQPGGGFKQPNFSDAYAHFARQELPTFAYMDPIKAGLAKVECIRAIYKGIMAARGR